MKILHFLFAFLLVSIVNGQDAPIIKFEKLVHDFGELTSGDKAETNFVFTNTGKAPLILSNVRSSCGCTVPTWTKEPILPGKKGTIKVVYDSNRIGPINKQITVESNSSNGAINLRITGNISKKPDEIMPFQNYDKSSSPFVQ